MTFDDDILGDKDISLEEAEDEALHLHVVHVCSLIINAPSPELYPTKLVAGLSPMIRRLNIKQWARRRRHKKRLMLFHPLWRARVLSELGGLKALDRWFKHHARLLKHGVIKKGETKHKRPELSLEEQARRAHIRACAKATANPQIIRDPYKMDHEGEFRLAPLPRCAVPLSSPSKHPVWKVERDRNRNYDFNPVPVMRPDMLSSPIHVTAHDFVWAIQAEEDEAAYQEALQIKQYVKFELTRIGDKVRTRKLIAIKLCYQNLGISPTAFKPKPQLSRIHWKRRQQNEPPAGIPMNTRIRDPVNGLTVRKKASLIGINEAKTTGRKGIERHTK